MPYVDTHPHYTTPASHDPAASAAAAAEAPRAQSLLAMNPKEFVEHMESVGQNRLFAVYDADHKAVKVSHPAFSELASFFGDDKIDYRVCWLLLSDAMWSSL